MLAPLLAHAQFVATRFVARWLLVVFMTGRVVAQTAPDLTAIDLGTIDRVVTYNLGPTGLRGWIYSHGGGAGSFGRHTSHQPWQILVTTVGTNTPATGNLEVNDVLLGVSTGSAAVPVPLFSQDARRSLGLAIGAAEAGDGTLNLKRWRAGVVSDVTLQLPVLGAYAATVPFNCPKSALIRSNLLNRIRTQNFAGPYLHGSVKALALLAAGTDADLPKVREFVLPLANLVKGTVPGQIDGWVSGYEAILLAEYYLLTRDAEVLDGLTHLTRVLAGSQSYSGTFGHGGADVTSPVYERRYLGGYGTVNAASLTANLGIVLGRRALRESGREVSGDIDAAIARAAHFYTYFVGKGGIPYGEHSPYLTHEDNGKNAMAALFFAALGDRPQETEYFARLSVAAFNGRQLRPICARKPGTWTWGAAATD
jgi:hypothetical protein